MFYVYVSDDYELNEAPVCYAAATLPTNTAYALAVIANELSARGYHRVIDNDYCEFHNATVGDGCYWFKLSTQSTIYVWVDDTKMGDTSSTAHNVVARLLSHH